MDKIVLTADELKKMDPEYIFAAIIALWGMEGASQVVHYYFTDQNVSTEVQSLDETDQAFDAINEGIDAFAEVLAELITRKLKDD